MISVDDTVNDKCFDICTDNEIQENPRLNVGSSTKMRKDDSIHTNKYAEKYSDQSIMAQSLINTSELNSINISKLQNAEVSKFQDQDSDWSKSKLSETSLNETTNNQNQDVSKFQDQDSLWSVNKSAKENPDVIEINSTCLDASEFQEQDSNWNKTVNQTVNNGNQNVSKFQDQDSNWSVNKSNLDGTLTDQTINNGNHSVSKFQDQDSNWSVNKTKLEETTTTANDSRDYIAVSINSMNNSEWNSDPDEPIVTYKKSADKQKKFKLIDDLSDVSKKLQFEEFVPVEENQPSPSYIQKFDGFILKVNSLDSFCVQLDVADNRLFDMKSELEKCRKPLDKNNIQVGTECVAPYHLDNQHYRAQIIEVSTSNTSNVSFNTSMRYPENKVKVSWKLH